MLILALAACRGAPEAFAPDLESAFDDAGSGVAIHVLVTGADPGLGERLAGVTLATLDRAAARDLAQRGDLYLTPDRPLGAAGRDADAHGTDSGATYTAEADLVRRALGLEGVALDGEGVTIGIVDSGVRRNHPDLPRDFVVAAADFVGSDDAEATRDDYGHGTAVAGVIAGTRAGARGVAPGVSIVSARVLDDDGVGTVSAAIRALDWLVAEAPETGVRVINLSVGSPARESFTRDPLAQAVESALDAGIVVVASAGNYGQSDGRDAYGGILSPATHPGVITVGASDPADTARRSDDAVAPWSSRGPTPFDGLGKPDVVAPGAHLAVPARAGSTLWTAFPAAHVASWPAADLDGAPYLVASGTSLAAPAVAGVVALILEADPALGPADVKGILSLTAAPLGDGLSGGAGLVNAAGATRLATWWADGGPTPVPSDRIAGEEIAWGLALFWDGYARGSRDLTRVTTFVPDAVGDLDGTGIIWDGYRADDRTLRYVGYTVSGSDLLGPQEAWAGALWGEGIIWDGDLTFAGGRVWGGPISWLSAMVWPDRLLAAGGTSPLFETPSFSGLTTPVEGGRDPTPTEPAFGR